jgi:hypothetical protein
MIALGIACAALCGGAVVASRLFGAVVWWVQKTMM